MFVNLKDDFSDMYAPYLNQPYNKFFLNHFCYTNRNNRKILSALEIKFG